MGKKEKLWNERENQKRERHRQYEVKRGKMEILLPSYDAVFHNQNFQTAPTPSQDSLTLEEDRKYEY